MPTEPRMASRKIVGLAACASYERDVVIAALRKSLEPLGGMQAFVAPGERIAIKPNLLLAAHPDSAVTTHPAVVEAVAALVVECGAHPVVVESPGAGIPYSMATLRRVYRRTGMLELSERTGLELSFDTSSSRAVTHPEGRVTNRVDVLVPILEADGVISLPKLKTHYFMTYTGAVKNLFGVVPGLAKPGYHARLADARRFADLLLDISLLVAPRLSVMDAVLAMEGDGPGLGGSPRMIGALLAGADPVALDLAACRLVGLPPERVPTLTAARDRGMWSGRFDDVHLIGDALESLQVSDFRIPDRSADEVGLGRAAWLGGVLTPIMRDLFSARPRPRAGRCTGCETCRRACPARAIEMRDRLAVVDDGSCIRCYCCHELCPEAAVDLEFGRAARLVRTLGLR
ncbi:MAG TPA: DUF362 domain-containing protein [Thermoleophilia bacterium]|nr:DUF362 domain-containing protein [Thermoleophilia bacterium]